MKKLLLIWSLLFSVVSIFAYSQTAKADDTQNKRSYSVQAILPDNQKNKDVSYYDLQVEPNQPTTLELMVVNTGTEKINVEVELNNAYTTDSATIGYDQYKAQLYKNKIPSLDSLVDGPRKTSVALDKGEIKKVSFKIKAPDQPFAGIILGGVTSTATVNTAGKEKVGVSNQIRYVKGVVLHSKSDEVTPNMNLIKAEPRAINDEMGLSYTVDNLAPININDVSVKAVIKHRGMKDIKYLAKNLQIAPDSKFSYFIPIDHLKPGIYSTKLTFTSKSGYSKTMTNKLKVSQGFIHALDETKHETSSAMGLIYVIIGLFAVLVIGLWLFMYNTGKKMGFKKHRK